MNTKQIATANGEKFHLILRTAQRRSSDLLIGDTIKTNWFANEAIRYILSLSPDALKKYMLVPLEPPLISESLQPL